MLRRKMTTLLATLAVAVLFVSSSFVHGSPTTIRHRQLEECGDMAKIYDVHVDIQIAFQGNNKAQCDGQWSTIQNAVTEALNDNFDRRVPDWDGQVGFGPVAFDESSTVDNTRRFLRDNQSGFVIEQGVRRLASCPVQRDIRCETDLCLWGCLTAPTTSCGVNALTNWHLLGQDIEDALEDLDLDCLGKSPVVNVLVTDPDEIYVPELDSEDTRPTRREDDVAGSELVLLSSHVDAGAATQTLVVKSTITITFFGGLGALPDTSGVQAAQAAVVSFYTAQFENDEDFGPIFQQFSMDSITPEYDFNTPDEFVLKFDSHVVIEEGSDLTSADAAGVMAGAPFREFITDYVRTLGGEFSRTFKIHFRGVAHSRSRR